MFSPSAIELLTDILQLFAYSNRCPIALYEFDGTGNVVESVRSDEQIFPSYCQALWSSQEGTGRQLCDSNMCGRARHVLQLKTSETVLCHGGLSNITDPIVVENRPVAAIQYGAFLPYEDPSADERQRHLDEVVENLAISPTAAAEMRQRFGQTRRLRPSELDDLRRLTPILQRTIARYILHGEHERRMQAAANHDLQLRLQAILAHAENLKNELPPDSPYLESLNNIMGATEAGGAVMHSLTRGQYLPEEYVFRWHPVREFIDRALTLSSAEARRKGMHFVVGLEPQDGAYRLQASAAHLQQAFNNLVQNAVKYSYRTTVLSTKRYVKIRGRPSRNGYEIVVSNFGVGIEPDELESIFQEGYKGRLTKAEYRTGSGQGLTLTKRVVERHGGTVTPSSEPQGDRDSEGTQPYVTRFTVWLPQRRTA